MKDLRRRGNGMRLMLSSVCAVTLLLSASLWWRSIELTRTTTTTTSIDAKTMFLATARAFVGTSIPPVAERKSQG